MRIGLRHMWWKKEPPQWHWWYRFKEPIAMFHTSGCFNDFHSDISDGCSCNNFLRDRKEWEGMGFKEVACFNGKHIYANEHRSIVIETISYGR